MRQTRMSNALAAISRRVCAHSIVVLLCVRLTSLTASAGDEVCAPDLGRALYTANCLPCHGKEGKGDGDMAIVLPTPCSDLTDSSLQELSDKSILKIVMRGRGEMPRFKRLLTEAGRAQIIRYLRKLSQDNPNAKKAKSQ